MSFWSEPRGPIVFFKARLGIAASAGSPLKRSVPWGFAVAQHGFRGFDRGSSYFFRGIRRLRPAVPPWSWKPAETVRSLGFCRGAARLSRLRPGSTSCFSIGGSEGYVRHCRLGAGSPLKRSGPLGFAVAQRGFRGFARGSTSYFSIGVQKVTSHLRLGAGSPLKRGTARLSRLRPGLYELLL